MNIAIILVYKKIPFLDLISSLAGESAGSKKERERRRDKGPCDFCGRGFYHHLMKFPYPDPLQSVPNECLLQIRVQPHDGPVLEEDALRERRRQRSRLHG